MIYSYCKHLILGVGGFNFGGEGCKSGKHCIPLAPPTDLEKLLVHSGGQEVKKYLRPKHLNQKRG